MYSSLPSETEKTPLLDEKSECVRFLYRGVPTALAVNIGIGILFIWVCWYRVDRQELLYWTIALSLTIVARGIGAFLFRRHATEVQDLSYWKNLFLIMSTLSGVIWGMSIWYLGPFAELETPVLITFVLGGLTAGAAAILGSVLQVYYAYLYATMLPVTIWFFTQETESHYIMAIMLVTYILAMMSGGYIYRKVVVRSITLSNELAVAKDQAEKANRAKSEFLSRMSHELRTPLNAVVGFGQLLELSDLKNQDQINARHIVQAGKHLTNMVNEILDIARIESGSHEITHEVVLIENVLQESWALVQALANEQGVTLEMAQENNCSNYIYADPTRLRQVFVNLLSNAIKYNSAHGKVSVSCTRFDKIIRISFSDTGPGIEPEKLELLFHPFERLGAESSQIEGTGIGLAVVKALTQAMDGSVGVESQLGQGSTFWVEFKACTDVSRYNSVVGPADEPSVVKYNRIHSTGRTILYIEDNIANYRLVETALKKWADVQLLHTTLGQSGYNMTVDLQPDLVLLDIHLPDISGHEVIQKLKSNRATKDIPVIVLSADATQQQIEQLMEAGASAYLTKPLELGDLINTLDETLKLK